MGDKYVGIYNQYLYTSSMNIGNSTKSSEVGQLEDKDDSINHLVPDVEAGTDGSYRDKDMPKGLKYLLVVPRWRKNTPNNDDNADELDKMAIINRLSYDNRIKILEKTLDFYDGNKTEEVLDVKTEFNTESWQELLNQCKARGQKRAETLIKHIDSWIDNLNEENHQTADTIYSFAPSATVLGTKRNLESRKKLIRENTPSLVALDKSIAHIKDDIIQNGLKLKNADNLQSGYLYIFLQTELEQDKDGNKPYSKLKLYSEHKVLSTKDEYSFKELDISDYENVDSRGKKDTPAKAIKLPVCYLENKEAKNIEVKVLFSHNQLSGARLKKICEDNPAHLRKLDANKLRQT
ncbi:toxin VasX, partial [Francisella philomiragia]|uniref:toxin VasX n=1 Tax=Francisella philomiragia TaxID=28110 RepID=UPI0019067EF8